MQITDAARAPSRGWLAGLLIFAEESRVLGEC